MLRLETAHDVSGVAGEGEERKGGEEEEKEESETYLHPRNTVVG